MSAIERSKPLTVQTSLSDAAMSNVSPCLSRSRLRNPEQEYQRHAYLTTMCGVPRCFRSHFHRNGAFCSSSGRFVEGAAARCFCGEDHFHSALTREVLKKAFNIEDEGFPPSPRSRTERDSGLSSSSPDIFADRRSSGTASPDPESVLPTPTNFSTIRFSSTSFSEFAVKEAPRNFSPESHPMLDKSTLSSRKSSMSPEDKHAFISEARPQGPTRPRALERTILDGGRRATDKNNTNAVGNGKVVEPKLRKTGHAHSPPNPADNYHLTSRHCAVHKTEYERKISNCEGDCSTPPIVQMNDKCEPKRSSTSDGHLDYYYEKRETAEDRMKRKISCSSFRRNGENPHDFRSAARVRSGCEVVPRSMTPAAPSPPPLSPPRAKETIDVKMQRFLSRTSDIIDAQKVGAGIKVEKLSSTDDNNNNVPSSEEVFRSRVADLVDAMARVEIRVPTAESIRDESGKDLDGADDLARSSKSQAISREDWSSDPLLSKVTSTEDEDKNRKRTQFSPQQSTVIESSNALSQEKEKSLKKDALYPNLSTPQLSRHTPSLPPQFLAPQSKVIAKVDTSIMKPLEAFPKPKSWCSKEKTKNREQSSPQIPPHHSIFSRSLSAPKQATKVPKSNGPIVSQSQALRAEVEAENRKQSSAKVRSKPSSQPLSNIPPPSQPQSPLKISPPREELQSTPPSIRLQILDKRILRVVNVPMAWREKLYHYVNTLDYHMAKHLNDGDSIGVELIFVEPYQATRARDRFDLSKVRVD